MSEPSRSSKIFLGVHFVLFGFDSGSESEVRSKLLSGGGVDAGQYGSSCTHVIVHNLVYDNPVCFAARNDGKNLLTELWVEHSFDVGGQSDVTSILYRPLKDLNGIPGSKRLTICLTGYLRQDREDIMTMVGLMGAQFSKPLVANKVTHLICYKFEGDKYVLAKKLKSIKLVNHRWLEDCLRHWELLPEDKYDKSGYELETMEEEAKDSEEEAEDNNPRQHGGTIALKSPSNSKIGLATTTEVPNSIRKISKLLPDSEAIQGPLKVDNVKDSLLIPGNESHRASTSHSISSPKSSFQDAEVPMDAMAHQIPDANVRTSESRNAEKDLAISFKFEDMIHLSGSKANSATYSRKKPGKFSIPRNIKEGSVDGIDPSESLLGGMNFYDPKTCSFKNKNGENGANTFPVEGSSVGAKLVHGGNLSGTSPQERSTKVVHTNLKLQMSSDVNLCVERSPPTNGKPQGFRSASNGPSVTDVHSFDNDDKHLDDENAITPLKRDLTLTTKTSTSTPWSKTCTSPSTNSVMKTVQHDNSYQKIPHTYPQRLEKSKTYGEPDGACIGITSYELQRGEKQNVKLSSPCEKKSDAEKSGGKDVVNKSLPEKTATRKCLGSRSSGAKSSLNHSTKEDEDTEKSGMAKKLKTTHRTIDAHAVSKSTSVIKSLINMDMDSSSELVDVGIEVPHDNSTNDIEKETGEPESRIVSSPKKTHPITDEKSEELSHITKSDNVISSKESINVTGESSEKGKVNKKGKNCPMGRKQSHAGPDATYVLQPKVVEGEAETKNETVANSQMKKLKKGLHPSEGSNIRSADKTKDSSAEKENAPIIIEEQNICQEKSEIRKPAVLSSTEPTNKKRKVGKTGQNILVSAKVCQKGVKSEPVCFILSGHRLQRREFQQVIRRLKGRCCRDSHQWSYQATHFIAPDPIRRTEKFFAAAASGRWILRSDYLSACSQEGKFLPEEPYEWHNNGLSQDGAINMEAPRMWRLLRERTGHGAFYGMRIIVYGDCISPSLDTLKRVVKAGDGAILATSPPYTRFFDKGVHYAIISPGTPRVDLWVQEFLKHETPCIVADYLVEYVCKPGFPLEKHVLYGTQSWAQRSYANLQSRAEEVTDDYSIALEDCDSGDIECQVCRSRDRGHVMLICSNEDGSLGCGVGAHIDCCDPPLEQVPEEDWFCPKCTSRKSTNSPIRGKRESHLYLTKRESVSTP